MSKRNESIGVLTPKTYRHDLSHSHTTTLDWFRLQPVVCMEMLDGDKFSVNLASLIEAAPLATKVFGSAYLDFHAFFVPSRVVWKDWNNYRYGNSRGNTSNYTLPHIKMSTLNSNTGGMTLKPQNGEWVVTETDDSRRDRRRVFGGLGYPTQAVLNVAGDGSLGVDTSYADMPINIMQARCYQRIWWDWFRDSVNLTESAKNAYIFDSGGLANSAELAHLFQARYRCWRKDYITTLLESPQLGDVSSIGVNASYGISDTITDSSGWGELRIGKDSKLIGANMYSLESGSSSKQAISFSSNVSLLRGAIAMQRFLEKLNVTGTRPIERMQAIFGNSPTPVRLDMSELVGSHRQRITISGLTNTGSSSIIDTSQSEGLRKNAFGIDGNSAAFGQQTGRSYSESQSKNMNYTATEDGYFIVIASLMPDFVNPSATNRQFFRGLATPDASSYDFYTHEFDGLSYQECLYNEICLPEFTSSTQGLWGIDYDPYKVAGYQPKYEDYRYIQDRISGDFNEPSQSLALRNMVYLRNFQDTEQSGQIPTGIGLTTPSTEDRALFDNHFQITDSNLDHFILNLFVNVDAIRPVSNSELPTELSDYANSVSSEVSNGGIRL